jgi:hypothetical protein
MGLQKRVATRGARVEQRRVLPLSRDRGSVTRGEREKVKGRGREQAVGHGPAENRVERGQAEGTILCFL